MTRLNIKPADQTEPAVVSAMYSPIPADLTELQRRRLYEKRLEADQKAELAAKSGPFRKLLFETYDEDTAQRLWMRIEPMLNAGKEGVRRNVGVNMRGRAVATA